jgi:hypothetical protein
MLSECLATLAATLGLPPEPYSGEGPFRLRLEDDLELRFERQARALAVRLSLAPVPASAHERREFLREALKISLSLMAGGRPAVFPCPALDQDEGLVLEARLEDEPKAFLDGVESFLNEAEKWRLALRAARTGGSRDSAPSFILQGLRP